MACVGTTIGASDFVGGFTPSAGISYCLTENVTVSSGTAVDGGGNDNWTLDLNGYTITYADTGLGMWADLDG